MGLIRPKSSLAHFRERTGSELQQAPEPVSIQAPFHLVCQAIELLQAVALVVYGLRALCAEARPGQNGLAGRRLVKESVQVGARYLAIIADRAIRAAVQLCKRADQRSAFGDACSQ